jgi:hypothetical protein
MYDHAAKINQSPLIVRAFAGTAEYRDFPFAAKFFYSPFKAVHVGLACNCGNYKKVGPVVYTPQIKRANILPVMLPQKRSYFRANSVSFR